MKFSLVQALRGIASLWVVLFHLNNGGAIAGMTARLPSWLSYALFGYGSAGVAVFFVLSGFVIAHSLNGKSMGVGELGRFALRRSLRLDPPYWVSIAFASTVAVILAVAHHQPASLPTVGQLLAHLFYAQELLHVPEIQLVYWTLTYEVQFYLVFAVAMCIGWRRSWLPLFALALVSATQGGEWTLHGLFANLWHGFFLGVLAYRAGVLGERAWPLLLLATVTLICQGNGVFALPCAFTGLLLFAAARTNRLTMLSSRPWQWLGAISYSLYLVHLPTLRLLMGAWQRVAGHNADAMAFVVLTGACIAVAAVFYWLIERPSHTLSKRVFAIRPAFAPSYGR